LAVSFACRSGAFEEILENYGGNEMKKLGFGLMRLPFVGEYNNVNIEAFQRLADIFLQRGFTYFDTAYPYHGGNSETAFREAVAKRYHRDSYIIADKMPMFSIQQKYQLSQIFDEQLTRCGVEYFDYYMLHNLNRLTYDVTQKTDAFGFIKQKKIENKIKRIGFSFHDNAGLLDIILAEHPEVEFVQLQMNYVDIDDISVESGKCYEVVLKYGKDVIVMEPLKGGVLAKVPNEADALFKARNPNVSAASWALRYAASFKEVIMVLSGMSSEEQLSDNIGTMSDFTPLDEDDKAVILRVAGIFKAGNTIPCTECRYCVDACSQHIAIPEYFNIYNNLKRFETTQLPVAKAYYGNLIQNFGKASDCTQCGICEEHCPQHLPISKHLREIAAALE
jgi:predicted aldo/keto reductase-like oxidoreductase